LAAADHRRTCATCGATLPSSGADAGLCTRCLVRIGLDKQVATASVPGPELQPGTRIGPYRLIEKIGEGGMGVVYRAEQKEPVRRTVAIKLIRSGVDTSQVVARFEAERQALALMDHPGIARLHDAGTTEDGRPYFVMEYVAGEPVTTYCDRRRLGTNERVALFIEVCDAVQHAHHRGVIHRDLKPANVLVAEIDRRAAARIIDFGVAKATRHKLTSRTLVTQLGLAIGTPEYMSPEQASGTGLDVDSRTDVYALGVLLYELLVGVLPFDPAELRRAAFDEALRRIREEDPPRPSQRLATLGDASGESASRRSTDVRSLGRELQGDLDWIVMKTLEKDRNRRYGSPAELVADLKRHLADEPVTAGPPSAAYRARKFVRRHRIGVAVAATAILALIATAVGTSYGLVRALEAEREARENAVTAERVSSFLIGLFEVTDPNARQGRDLTAREVFDAGAEKVARELADEPLLRARMLRTFGTVYLNLGINDTAERTLREAIGIEQGQGARQAEARTAEVLAHTLYLSGRGDEAAVIARDAIDTWSELGVTDDPALAQAHIVLGSISLYHRAAPDDAEPHFILAHRILGSNPNARPVSVLTLRGHLAAIHWYRGDLRRFVAEAQDAVDYARAHGIGDTIAATVMERWAAFGPWSAGRPEEAEHIHREVLERQLAIIGGDSPQTLDTRWDLVDLVLEQGRHAEAAELGAQLASACERVLGRDDPETVVASIFTGEALRRAGESVRAIEVFEQAHERAREAGLPEDETATVIECYLHLVPARGDTPVEVRETISACAARLDSMATSRSDATGRLSLAHRARIDLSKAAAANGSTDLALEILEALVQGGYWDPLLEVRESFAPLREEPRFRALLERGASQR
jgi:non-specific serine/threonine protein kinase/serine/threonine-protein kinase